MTSNIATITPTYVPKSDRPRGIGPAATLGRPAPPQAAYVAPAAPEPPPETVSLEELRAHGYNPVPTVVAPADPNATTGKQTLFDITVGADPEQLVPPFLAPEGVTVLYGRGGVGKGMMSVSLAHQLVQQDHTVLIVDYEGHPREWARRARGMSFTDAELRRVHYRRPFGPEWTATKGSLAQVADLIRADCEALGVTYIVVDSYTTSTSTGDSMGGQAAAQEFFAAIERIGVPALVLAHVAGGQNRFPDKPFGSVFVHNLARETWAVESATDADVDVDYDHKTDEYQPIVMRLELRMMKKNDGVKETKPQFVNISFFRDGSIEVKPIEPPNPPLATVLHDILTRLGPMDVKALVKAVEDEGKGRKTSETIRKTMERKPRDFALNNAVTPNIWSAK